MKKVTYQATATTYNKSAIMKGAWAKVKEYGYSLSEALRAVWRVAKSGTHLSDKYTTTKSISKTRMVAMVNVANSHIAKVSYDSGVMAFLQGCRFRD